MKIEKVKLKIIKYFAVWLAASRASAAINFSDKVGVLFFLAGKMIRFGFFLLFLVILTGKTSALSNFTADQVIFFFLTFNLIDIASQTLFREVYWFRPQIVTGSFDLILSRPVNPLFRSLLGRADFSDLITLPPLVFLIIIFAVRLNPTIADVLLYFLFIINALVIAAAFHIAVLALGVVTTAIDHTMMIYRDVVGMGKIPIDFYREPLRGFLTFVIPVGIMMTVPAKVLMGIFDWKMLIFAFTFSLFAFCFSLYLWRLALRNYSSASS